MVASLSLLVDPLNGRQIWLEHVRHEAGHALAAVMLGFRFDDVAMDAYAEDFNRWGQLSGLRRDPLTASVPEMGTDVVAALEEFDYAVFRDSLDRSVVARLGVMSTLEQSWDGPGADGDREIVEVCRPSDYTVDVWDLIVEDAAYRLLRREDFRFKHGAVVGALERGRRLTFEQVTRLVSGSPDAGLLTAAASASASGVHRGGGKAANAGGEPGRQAGSGSPT